MIFGKLAKKRKSPMTMTVEEAELKGARIFSKKFGSRVRTKKEVINMVTSIGLAENQPAAEEFLSKIIGKKIFIHMNHWFFIDSYVVVKKVSLVSGEEGFKLETFGISY